MRRETKKGKEKREREIGQQKEEKTKQTYIQSRNNNELEHSLNTLLIRQTTQLTLKTVFLLYCRTQTLFSSYTFKYLYMLYMYVLINYKTSDFCLVIWMTFISLDVVLSKHYYEAKNERKK
jgi:hypothetical protein